MKTKIAKKNFQIGRKLQTHRYKKLKYTQAQNMEEKKTYLKLHYKQIA